MEKGGFPKNIQRGEGPKAPRKKWFSERNTLDETLSRENTIMGNEI